MKDFPKTNAYQSAVLAFKKIAEEKPSKIERLILLGELCKIIGIDYDPLLDYLNKEFVKLLYKHENDVHYDFPEKYQDGYDPDDELYICTIANAYEELMSYDPTFKEKFDYWIDLDFDNPWDAGIVRK